MRVNEAQRRVLEVFGGQRIGEQGDAAFWQTVETLRGNGLIERRRVGNKQEYSLTDTGRKALESSDV
jgi:DNA-binding PadR family transcriptional regulator